MILTLVSSLIVIIGVAVLSGSADTNNLGLVEKPWDSGGVAADVSKLLWLSLKPVGTIPVHVGRNYSECFELNTRCG